MQEMCIRDRIMDLENEYDTTVEDDALGTIKTVGDIVSYIEARLG